VTSLPIQMNFIICHSVNQTWIYVTESWLPLHVCGNTIAMQS